MLTLASRFTASARKESVLEAYVQFFSRDMPEWPLIINFEDASLQFEEDGANKQVGKSPRNNVYVHIPVSLDYEPSEDNVLKLRKALATMFAGNKEGRKADMCADALVLFGGLFPHRIIVFTGAGGDGKSLRTSLRKAVFGKCHGFLSPMCFNVPEEFRKQAGQIAHMNAVTIQECIGGSPLLEDVFKKFCSGDEIETRPNYGVETVYYAWDKCAKFWEMNLIVPCIHGDPKKPKDLESWTRRFLVVEMHSSFIATEDDVDVHNKMFLTDPELRIFFQSGEAACIYLKKFLFPFMAKCSRSICYQYIDKPPKALEDSTLQFVLKMANGGINDYIPEVMSYIMGDGWVAGGMHNF